jgi:hypothetical protein
MLRQFAPVHYAVVCRNAMPRGGGKTGGFQHRWDAVRYGMVLMYINISVPTSPRTGHTPKKYPRSEEIRARYEAGETGASLVQTFGISEQRVNQIFRGQRHSTKRVFMSMVKQVVAWPAIVFDGRFRLQPIDGFASLRS